jgi:uncharacterized protein YegJ (DUF2314 family)
MSHHQAVVAPAESPELAAATKAARTTFRYFWRELTWEQRCEDTELEMAGVKVVLADGDEVERAWLEFRDFDGREVCGALVTEPALVTSVSPGDLVHVAPAEIEDWLLVVSGTVYGAFTIQALRAQLGRRERRRHDRAWGIAFGEPGVVRHVHEGLDHPAAVGAAEMLRTHPDMVLMDGDDGVTALHREACAGNAVLVELLLRRGADRDARTPEGDTALDLARRMGWPRIVEMLHQ